MIPVRITHRHMSASPAVTEYIHKRVVKLERFYDRISSCEVVVEAPPHKNAHNIQVFSVRIDIVVPGQTISVHRNPLDHSLEEDIYVTINRAFHTLRRSLEDYARIQHGKVKHHSLPSVDEQ